MSAVHIAEKLSPYLYVIWTGLLVLVALTVLLGVFLVLRHAFTKSSFEGNSEYDKLKIAKEINEDIVKLTDLRNRLDPSYLAAMQSLAATADLASQIQQSEGGSATAPAAPLTDDEKKALEAAIEARFKDEITKLKEEIEKLKAGGATAAPAAGGEASPEKVQEALDKQKSQLGEETEKLRSQVGHLEKVLSEYRIFEDDFAYVKKLKAENEELKAQLGNAATAPAATPAPPVAAAPVAAVESPAPVAAAPVEAAAATSSPSTEDKLPADPAPVSEVTEDDIANLFEELKTPGADEGSSKKSLESAPLPETKVVMDPAPASESSPSPAAENKMVANEETAEALAETGNDELMAQFEKLLSEGQKA